MAPMREETVDSGFLTDAHFSIPIQIRSDPLTNDYEIESRPFARGKYAQVRRCKHKKTGVEYAAKQIRRRRRAADVRHEILHEIRILLMADQNDRIVKLHEVFETSTEYVLMLEMAEGGELQRVLDEEDCIPEKSVVKMMRQILEAIAFLHNNNIAHLDIKPQNILLVKSYPAVDVKLCDFGISRFIAEGSELREIVGTPDYVAPEILNYEPIGLATDMWSVGVLAFVLLTGYSPFGGDTKQETFYNITNGKLEFAEELFDGISSNAIDFISKLLVKNAEQRMTCKQCLQHEWLSGVNVDSFDISATKIPIPVLEYDSDKENKATANGNETKSTANVLNESTVKGDDLKNRLLNVYGTVREESDDCIISSKSATNTPATKSFLHVEKCSRSRSLSLERRSVESIESSALLLSSSTRITTTSSSIDFESVSLRSRTLVFCDEPSEERVAIVC